MLPANEKMSAHNQMKVCVIVVTFNDEKRISEAINSIIIQEVNFYYEILIIEDCSKDRT